MSAIKVDDRVTWQDGDVQRIGFVGLIFDDGKAFVQDYATYSWEVEVSRLVPTPITDEERQAFLTSIRSRE